MENKEEPLNKALTELKDGKSDILILGAEFLSPEMKQLLGIKNK